jgi:hypothetical protein
MVSSVSVKFHFWQRFFIFAKYDHGLSGEFFSLPAKMSMSGFYSNSLYYGD